MIEATIFARQIDETFSLRLFEVSDAPALYASINANRHHLSEWLPWVKSTISTMDSKVFIEDTRWKHERSESLVIGIWCEQAIIGCIGLNEIQLVHRKATIGYWLAADQQGKGVITRACHLLIDYAFEELRLNRVEILCAVDNHRSQAVAGRLGFRKEGVLRDYLYLHTTYTDAILYGMLRKDWNK